MHHHHHHLEDTREVTRKSQMGIMFFLALIDTGAILDHRQKPKQACEKFASRIRT